MSSSDCIECEFHFSTVRANAGKRSVSMIPHLPQSYLLYSLHLTDCIHRTSIARRTRKIWWQLNGKNPKGAMPKLSEREIQR